MSYPKTIRVDQGTEFVSRDLDLWAHAKGVTLYFSRPGKPTDTAFETAFNRRVRVKCLNALPFRRLLRLFLSVQPTRSKPFDSAPTLMLAPASPEQPATQLGRRRARVRAQVRTQHRLVAPTGPIANPSLPPAQSPEAGESRTEPAPEPPIAVPIDTNWR